MRTGAFASKVRKGLDDIHRWVFDLPLVLHIGIIIFAVSSLILAAGEGLDVIPSHGPTWLWLMDGSIVLLAIADHIWFWQRMR